MQTLEYVRPILVKHSDAMLEVRQFSAGYGPVVVVRDANLIVNAGEVVGLVGRNGAGKTTFISAIAGLLDRTSGAIRLCDRDISGLEANERVNAGLCVGAERRTSIQEPHSRREPFDWAAATDG